MVCRLVDGKKNGRARRKEMNGRNVKNNIAYACGVRMEGVGLVAVGVAMYILLCIT